MSKKRYFWIKLRKSFLTSDAVDFLMSQKNGSQYVVLYQMLCLKTANTQGKLARKIGDVLLKFDIDKIARDTKYFDVDTIRVALELYKKLGLVYVGDNEILQIANFDKMIGSETKWAKYKRIERNKEDTKKLENVQKVSNKILDIRDKSIDKDIRLIDKDINNKNKDLKTSSETIKNCSKQVEKIFIEIILNDKNYHKVTEKEVERYEKLYPAVNIESEIRKMVGWCESNPTRRKTKRGINSFINAWLAKKQDKPNPNYQKQKETIEEEIPKKESKKVDKKFVSEGLDYLKKLQEEE